MENNIMDQSQPFCASGFSDYTCMLGKVYNFSFKWENVYQLDKWLQTLGGILNY